MIEKAARLMYEEDGKNFDSYPYSYERSTWEQLKSPTDSTRRTYIRKAQIAWDTFADVG